jgi:heterotetrameric sarcosine oxidase delta subunit
MLVIECPVCGPRNSSEFSYSGLVKPRPTGTNDPAEWRKYLYEQNNFAGFAKERWFHVSGCRKFIDVERSSITNEITSIIQVGTTQEGRG